MTVRAKLTNRSRQNKYGWVPNKMYSAEKTRTFLFSSLLFRT